MKLFHYFHEAIKPIVVLILIVLILVVLIQYHITLIGAKDVIYRR